MNQAILDRTAGTEGTAAPRLELRADGQLWIGQDGAARPVRVARCFPWSAPGHFISLRDERRNEVALIADPATLDARSRELLEDALVEADFVFEIEAIDAIEEETEIRCWSVDTRQGPRRFQTRRDDWPRPVPGGGLLIRDVAGDLFHIAVPARLDARSRKLLWAYVD
jgi:hypothetical protein